jgi:hypothetical protein
MSIDYSNLQLHEWKNLSVGEAIIYSEGLVKYLPHNLQLVKVDSHSYCGDRNLVAYFKYDNSLFSLIPGASVQLGFDAKNFQPTKEQLESFKDTAEEYGIDLNINDYIKTVTTPLRTVKISPFLVEVESQEIGWEAIDPNQPEILNLLKEDVSGVEVSGEYRVKRNNDGSISAWQFVDRTYQDITIELKSSRLRLLTSDEWEYICGGGKNTLFRWGNFSLCDRYPTDNTADEILRKREWVISGGKIPYTPDEPDWNLHLIPNFFGLKIAQDPYDLEIVAEKNLIRGGDGGCSICGGEGFFMGWLPLATSYSNPDVSEDEVDFSLGSFYMRRVIPII